jgi:hypothetical protein
MKKSLTFLVIGGVMFSSCRSNELYDVDPVEALAVESSKFNDIGHFILTENHLDKNFKEFLYGEIEKQFDGDYNVLVDVLLEKNGNSKSKQLGFSKRITDDLQVQNIYPQVFIPFYAELKAEEILGSKDPIVVFHTSDETIREYPGFALNDKGELEELDFLISEEFAMQNEIWVISPNERVGNKDFVSLDKEDEGRALKVASFGNGDLHVAQIMVPDLGAIESWIEGKIELGLRAFSPGVPNLLNYSYPQIKRDKLKDQRWYSVGTHICNWTSAVGDYIVLHWTEYDGGSTSTPVTINYPATPTSPAMSYTFTLKTDDDDLGYAAVLKTDNPNNVPFVGTLYNTGKIQWKMGMIL